MKSVRIAGMKHKSVFVLKKIVPTVALDGKKGHYALNENGNVKCTYCIVGVFDSVKKAEAAILQIVKSEADEQSRYDSWYGNFGYVIDENYVNEAFCGKYNDCERVFESCRSYLNDGSLNYVSDCDFACEKKFIGRDDRFKMHVKKGDYALKWTGNSIVPILIGELPLTKSQWKERFESGVSGDFSDDSGVDFTASYGHDHTFAPNVFPLSCLPCFKISAETKRALKKEWEEYYGKRN